MEDICSDLRFNVFNLEIGNPLSLGFFFIILFITIFIFEKKKKQFEENVFSNNLVFIMK